MLIDIRNKNINGKQASDLLDAIGITVNKNAIPNDPLPPLKTSGIRVGTPACTTRGMKEKEFETIAAIIDEALSNPKDAALHTQLRKRTRELCEAFPLYGAMMKELF
jgi:glycine hydroxymethyltransferase